MANNGETIKRQVTLTYVITEEVAKKLAAIHSESWSWPADYSEIDAAEYWVRMQLAMGVGWIEDAIGVRIEASGPVV